MREQPTIRGLARGAAAFMLLVTACSAGEDTGSSFGGLSTPTGASGPASTPGGDTAETGDATDAAGTTDATASTGGGEASASTSATTGSDGAEDSGDPVPNPEGLPNGSECSDPGACMTGNCYKVPLPVGDLPPGICAECDADADCVAAGLGTACSVDAETLGAVCGYGNEGSFCETQAACQDDLVCTALIDGAEGLLPHTCSECDSDADCGGALRCLPVIDVATYSGQKRCTVPGSVGQGGLCPLPDGDPMCVTHKCAVLSLAGLLDVGVCGQCKSDGDCAVGQTCDPPKFQDGFIASKCI